MYKYNGIVMIGAPGSGKSTICRAIQQVRNISYISSGDIAREMAACDTGVGLKLAKGLMAPEERMRDAMCNRIRTAFDSNTRFILDGFPRNLEQDLWIYSIFQTIRLLYVHIDCTYDVILRRLYERNRDDDTINAINDRVIYFIKKTLPVLELHESIKISTEKLSKDEMGILSHTILEEFEC